MKLKSADAIIIGCGISGGVVARVLAERGMKVLILERRSHIAGNMYDYRDEYGVLVHKYGPHIFHTVDKEAIQFISRFSRWKKYELRCAAIIDGKETPTPFNFKTIDDFFPAGKAALLKTRLGDVFGIRKTVPVLEALKAEDEMVREYARFLFEKDYALYTAKQWGVPPAEIDPSILERVPLRLSYENRYFDDEYQVMPENSYTDFFQSLLAHPNIQVSLNFEALKVLTISEDKKNLLIDGRGAESPVIYTGALDELFSCALGVLPYRSLRFEWKHEDVESFQGVPVVAYPQAQCFTRITEYKKLPFQDVKGTTYAVEYPLQYRPGEMREPYYPVVNEDNRKMHAQYEEMARGVRNLYYCGRLAEYRYYNMDQALLRALRLGESIQ